MTDEIDVGRFDGPISTLDNHISKVADQLCIHGDVIAFICDQKFGQEAFIVDPVLEGCVTF